MGWCSATEIMDAAVGAADKLAEGTYVALGVDPERVTLEDIRPQLDDLMRPFVTAIATKLRDSDWDCETDSEYFDRFPQEMLGMDDIEYAQWVRDQEG